MSTRITGSRKVERLPKGQSALRLAIVLAVLLIGFLGACAWIGLKASIIQARLEESQSLVRTLQKAALDNDGALATTTLADLEQRTGEARRQTEDPLWSLASALPWIGTNLSAVSEVARSADDVANLGVGPLVQVVTTLDWHSLMPNGASINLSSISDATPRLTSAAHAVDASASRLERIESQGLLPQISDPLLNVRSELRSASNSLKAASDAAGLAGSMLGGSQPRAYLLLIQNNAEVRSSGGIPTALAVLTVKNGKLELSSQTTANALGRMQTPLKVDKEQEVIYSNRIGKFMQDVNLTPDFPTAASTAREMWLQKTGSALDGVLSVDPVALSYLLEATGPVALNGEGHPKVQGPRSLPSELNSSNVVRTLMSDVYSAIPEPSNQDLYFAAVAKEVFSTLVSTTSKPEALFNAIQRSASDQRLLLWSAHSNEEQVLSKYLVGGSIARESAPPAQFAVYFNDGTGAKMDYYVKRTVHLIRECSADGYEETTVRVTSSNTAPADAGRSLPAYVTGGGSYGVAPGSVQTNIVAYGPTQATVESATVDGQKVPFAPYLHANRPVGVVAQQLAPGESKTVDFTFGKIVQHVEPSLVVTPTIQPAKDVIGPTEEASCQH